MAHIDDVNAREAASWAADRAEIWKLKQRIADLEQQLADYQAHAGDFAEECHRLNAQLDRAVELVVIAEDEKAQMERDLEELRDAHLARGNYVLEVERERDEAKEFQARAEALLESCEVERDGYFDALTKRNYEVLNLSSQLEGARRERDKAKGGPRDPLGLLAENVDLSSQLEGARRERDEAWDRYAEVVTENREMRALLGQVIDGDDVAVEAAVLLHSGFTPLTAVEVERVKGLEAVAEAAKALYGALLRYDNQAQVWDETDDLTSALAALEVKDE